MCPIGHVVLIGALREDLSLAGGRRKPIIIAELKTVLIGKESVESVILAEIVVPSAHRLVVVIAAGVPCSEEVLRQSAEIAVGFWIVTKNFRADRADAAGRNFVVREEIPDVS